MKISKIQLKEFKRFDAPRKLLPSLALMVVGKVPSSMHLRNNPKTIKVLEKEKRILFFQSYFTQFFQRKLISMIGRALLRYGRMMGLNNLIRKVSILEPHIDSLQI
jgi:hypothetical protein